MAFRALGLPPGTGIVVGFIAGALLGPLALLLLAPLGLVLMPTLMSKPGSRYAVAVERDKRTVSSTFARAPYYIIVEDGAIVKEVENPYVEATPAGPKSVELIAQYSPESAVAGNFGPIALAELSRRGIRPVFYRGTIEELLKR